MNPGTNRTQLEESIQSCCKSLFLTSAIPELIKSEGTPKQVEYLCTALQKEVIRREENRRSSFGEAELIFQHTRHLKAMSIAV
ncbi:MAG: hypothetical protein ACLU6Y_02810 [Ruminococcus sp.]